MTIGGGGGVIVSDHPPETSPTPSRHIRDLGLPASTQNLGTPHFEGVDQEGGKTETCPGNRVAYLSQYAPPMPQVLLHGRSYPPTSPAMSLGVLGIKPNPWDCSGGAWPYPQTHCTPTYAQKVLPVAFPAKPLSEVPTFAQFGAGGTASEEKGRVWRVPVRMPVDTSGCT